MNRLFKLYRWYVIYGKVFLKNYWLTKRGLLGEQSEVGLEDQGPRLHRLPTRGTGLQNSYINMRGVSQAGADKEVEDRLH